MSETISKLQGESFLSLYSNTEIHLYLTMATATRNAAR